MTLKVFLIHTNQRGAKENKETRLRFKLGFSNRRQAAPFPAQLRENDLIKRRHTYTETQTHTGIICVPIPSRGEG